MLNSVFRSARLLALTAVFGALSAGTVFAQETSPVGDWEGAVETPGGSVALLFHVATGDDGAFSATLDSPSQGGFGIPLEDVSFVDGVLSFGLAMAQASYEGTLSDDGATLAGMWSQMGNSIELNMTRSEN